MTALDVREAAPGTGTASYRTDAATTRSVHRDGTAASRSSAVWHAVATVYRVVGTRGRLRSVIVVSRCPWCGRPHVHSGKPDFVSGKRTASCKGGRYLVLVGVLEGDTEAVPYGR